MAQAAQKERMQKAFDYVDEHFDSMLEELKAVCAFCSTAADPEGLEATRGHIVAKMESLALSPRLHPVEGGNALISAGYEGSCGETLLFYNHYDVVEPGKFENWTIRDPFDARIADGRIYARGVSDNKGALYSRLHAVQAMLAVSGESPVGLKFLVEGDEEISSPSMHRFIKTQSETFRELTRADVCVWENGCNDDSGHSWLRMGVRGSAAFDLRVTTSNTDVHGRMGAAVPSASWRMVWALATLKTPGERVAIEGFYDRVLPAAERDLEVLRAFPYEEKAMKQRMGFSEYLGNAEGEELKRRVYMEPSLSICGLEAGEVHNGVRGIVPHTAYARVSFYLVADQAPSELGGMLRRHFDRHGFPDVEITRCGGTDRPVRTPVDTPFRKRACDVAAEVFSQPMVVELTQLGAGPAGVFRDAWPELPIVGFGPANTGGNHHAPDENLKLDDYKNAVKYLIALFYSYEK